MRKDESGVFSPGEESTFQGITDRRKRLTKRKYQNPRPNRQCDHTFTFVIACFLLAN
jgi:hypothetical protein